MIRQIMYGEETWAMNEEDKNVFAKNRNEKVAIDLRDFFDG